DAATVLSAIAESATDYRRFLQPDGLRGARIGVARKFHSGLSEHTDRVFEQSLEVVRQCGATLVDDVEIPGHAEMREKIQGMDVTPEGLVMQYEFKADLAEYLATRPAARVHNLADLIRFNLEHAAEEMPYFGQERLVESEARGPLTEALYLRARDQCA